MKRDEFSGVPKVIYVKIDDIKEENQPFTPLDEERYNKLKESIIQCGLIYPLVVVKTEDNKYRIVDGRNRYRILFELGAKEVPVFVLEHQALGNVAEYDLELFRRHLDSETLQLKENERNYYFDSLKKALRKKIFNLLELEESSHIGKVLDSMKFKELFELHERLQGLEEFTKTLRSLGKTVIKNALSSGEINLEDLRKEIDMVYQKALEEKDREIQEKSEEIFELQQKIEELTREYNKLKTEHNTLIEKQKKIKDEIEERIKKNYEKKLEEVTAELTRLQAQKVISDEEKRAMLEEIASKIRAEVKEKERRLSEEITEWRNTCEQLRRQIISIEREKEDLKSKLKNLENEKKQLLAERNIIDIQVRELKEFISRATGTALLSKHLETAKKSLESINEILDKYPPFADDVEKARFANIYEDFQNYVSLLGEKITNWAKTGGINNIFRQNRNTGIESYNN